MTDQSNVVLPKELRLTAPATMPQSRSYMFKQQAALTGYAPQDTIQINLPRLQRSYLTKDSYLEFEVAITYKADDARVNLFWDTPGALGLIDRIEVYDYLGSTQLESTSGFGPLVALLKDTHLNATEFGSHHELLSGGNGVKVALDYDTSPRDMTDLSDGDARNQIVDNTIYRNLQPSCGEVLDIAGMWLTNTGGAAASTEKTIYRRYHLPLFSFLGVLSPKYAPLHNGYTIMITLATADNALCATGVTVSGTTTPRVYTTKKATELTYSIKNARMCCQILELGPIAESMLLSTTGGQPMIVNTKAYRNYKTSTVAGAANFKLDLNINVASLTNVLWIQRLTSNINDRQFNSLSCRQRNFLESWYFQYGSSILPQTSGINTFKPIDNSATTFDYGTEGFIELLKARHLYNQANHPHQFNKANWAWDNYTRAAYMRLAHCATGQISDSYWFQYADCNSPVEKGKFACGLDLELVSGRTNEIICGMNTNGMNTAIFGTYNPTAAAVGASTTNANGVGVDAVTIDAWCEFDAFINISPGIATTVSF